jgi:hypothetical protein
MPSKSECAVKKIYKNKLKKFEIELSDDFSGPEISKKNSTDGFRLFE